MITGDNHLTGCQVATELKIATKPILVLNLNGSYDTVNSLQTKIYLRK